MRRVLVSVVLFGLLGAFPVSAASSFADPQFEAQWQAGEAVTPNFWGPLANAKPGEEESYKEAQDGLRLVQYFDKGRMEITKGTVTNGLLATEMIRGQIQQGDATFESHAPAVIPIAGDPDSAGPSYAQIQANGSRLLVASPSERNVSVTRYVNPSGPVTTFPKGANDTGATITAYDSQTQHNIAAVFDVFRAKAGLSTIGLAISEPFWSTVKVAGAPKDVLIQAFERRVLTYTPSNPDPYKVEFGNIGQHYRQWRYGSAAPIAPTSPTVQLPPSTGDAIGETFTCVCSFVSGATQKSVTVTDIKRATSVGTSTRPVGIFALVFARVTNLGKKPDTVSVGGVMLLDGQGRQYSMADVGPQVEAESQYGVKGPVSEIQPSLTLNEVFIFDIPQDATGLKLTAAQYG